MRKLRQRRPSARATAEPAASAPVFAALGDRTRLRLVARLCEGSPLSIATLTAGARITRQAVTKHLRVLESAGLVRSHRRGRESLWRLEHQRLREARRYLDQISMQWDGALTRLRNFVEE